MHPQMQGPFMTGGDDGGQQGPFVGRGDKEAKQQARERARQRAREVRSSRRMPAEPPPASAGPEASDRWMEGVERWQARRQRADRIGTTVIVIIAALLSFMFKGGVDRVTSHTPRPGAVTAPAVRTQGRFDVRIVAVQGSQVQVTGGGQTLQWRAGTDEMREALERSIGDDVLVYWRSEHGVTSIVGIEGPHASIAPDAGAPDNEAQQAA
jgi:hypothetical protein